MLSRTLLIALDGILLACLALRSQVHSQEARHSRSCLTICFHVCSRVLDPETCWIAGARHQEAGGGWRVEGGRWRVADGAWRMVAEIVTLVDITVWILSLGRPPWQDLTMPYGHGVDNCSLKLCSNGRQFKLGESRSPTLIFQRNLLPSSHRLWAYVCAFSLGLMEMMATAMAIAMAMAIVMVLVIVIIVPEVLRQVGWLRQCQHQSFHRLRAFY